MWITVTAVAVGMVLLSTTTLDAFMVPRPLSSSPSLSFASSNQLFAHRIGTTLSATTLNEDDQNDTVVSLLSSDDDRSISTNALVNPSSSMTTMMSTMAVLAMAMIPQAANAAGPDWGLFEGRIGSLLHPITMGGLFLFSLYTGFLGLQWKRQRTMGDEISTLKKSLPSLGESKSVAEALRLAKAGEGVSAGRILELENAVSIETRIQEMQQERKSLAEANPREQHFSQGAILAFIGTAFAIEVRCAFRSRVCFVFFCVIQRTENRLGG